MQPNADDSPGRELVRKVADSGGPSANFKTSDAAGTKIRKTGVGTEWFTPGRFALILAACIFAAYPEVVLGMRTFFFRDFGKFAYPLAYYHRETFWGGEIPLWNPLNNCGIPFLAQWNTMVLYPGSLFYLFMPLSWALGAFCLLHQFLAGLGMYFLARKWTGSPLGAAVAGVVFTFNGLTLNSLMWPAIMAALGWMPWLVIVTEEGLRQGGKRLTHAIIVGASQMLTGAPEIILFTWTLVGLLFVVDLACRKGERRVLVRRFGLVVMWITALSAIQLMPFLDLLNHSQRQAHDAGSVWSMPGTGWANFFVPLFHSYHDFQGVFFQYDQWWISSYYMGVGPVALAILAAWRVRRARAWILSALALAGLTLALGDNGYLYTWLRLALPQSGFVRFPIKFVAYAIFTLPLLMAFVFTRLDPLENVSLAVRTSILASLWAAISAVMAALLWFEWRYPFPLDDWTVIWENTAAREVFFTTFIVLLAVIHRMRNQRLRPLAGTGLLLVVWLDLMTHAPRPNPTVQRAVYEPGLVRLSPAARHGVCRAMISPAANLKLHSNWVASELNDYLGSRLSLGMDCNLLDGIAKVDGFFPLYLSYTGRICELLYHDSGVNAPSLLDFLSVAHVTAPGQLFDWEARANYLPFVTAGQQPIFANESSTLQAILSPVFAPDKQAYLSLESKSLVTAKPGPVQVLSSHFSAQQEQIQVEATAASLVVISQAYYHRWQANVDGQRTKIMRANYAFQAIEVPPGRHSIRLRYSDPFFEFGVGLSVAALTGLGLIAFGRTHRHKIAGLSMPQSGEPLALNERFCD